MKIEIKLLAAIALFGLSNSIQAQTDSSTSPQFGIKGGVNFSNIYNEDVDDNNMLTSFNAGVFAVLPISELIAIQPEVLYSRKGAELTYNNVFAKGKTKFNLNYIEVPVLLRVNLTKNLNIHAGPYIGFLIDANAKNESNGNTSTYNFDNDNFNKIDAGLSAGIGLDFDVFGFGARYNYGMTKIQKDIDFAGKNYSSEGKNSSISLYATFKLN